MRFIHTADLHLGKVLGKLSLEEDQRFILQEIIRIAGERRADALLLAGDIFDSTQPSAESICLLDEFLAMAQKENLPVFMIAGNHDSADRLAYGASLFTEQGIHIVTELESEIRVISFEREGEVCDIYLLPYTRRTALARLLTERPNAKADDFTGLMASYLAPSLERIHQRRIDGVPSLLIAHQWLVAAGGASLEAFENSSLGTVEVLGAEIFQDFDYVALGHLHRPQMAGENGYYPGSPLAYSAAEVLPVRPSCQHILVENASEKSLLEIDITAESKSVKRLPLHPLRPVSRIRDNLQTILSGLYDSYCQDYAYIELTDERLELDVYSKLKAHFPNLINIRYLAFEKQAQLSELTTVNAEDQRSVEELFLDFFSEYIGHAPNERQIKLVQKNLQPEE
ncbi:MAG: exonuclease SbcCD subunit D [Eubacteriales bacterium]|nr:exonuclease SbcCD subunit D [Eubacteriales bacterium]